MRFFLLLFICTNIIFAKNPAVYSSIGDELYSSLETIEKLKANIEFSDDKSKVDSYIDQVKASKDIGFAIEAGDKSIDKMVYLAKLRELSKIYKSFDTKGKIENSFKESVKNKNSKLFIAVVNAGAVDMEIYKGEVLAYYKEHADEIDPSGVIEKYLNEEIVTAKREELKIEQGKKKIEIHKYGNKADRIKQIRESSKRKEQQSEKLLDEEIKQKKEAILKIQKNELNLNP